MKFLHVIVLTLGVALAAHAKVDRKVVRHDQGVPDQYIVVLRAETSANAVEGIARSLAGSHGLVIDRIWNDTLKGFWFTRRMPRSLA